MFSFRAVRTFEELLRLNTEFLEGRLPLTPYHCGPIKEETLPLVEDLIRLHDVGFLSVNSQPARVDDEPVFVPQRWLAYGKHCGNWWVQIKQRPYLEGYMDLGRLEAFGKFMESHPDYFYSIYVLSEEQYRECLCWGARRTEIHLDLVMSTFPQSTYALTQDRCNASKRRVLADPWDTYTVYSKAGMPFDFQGYPNIQAIFLKSHPVMKVFIAGKHFGEGAVEKLLLDFLNTQI